MSIVEIENAIKKLPADKVGELVEWLQNYYAEVWDKRIADDLVPGRFDPVLAEVDRQIDAGLAEPL